MMRVDGFYQIIPVFIEVVIDLLRGDGGFVAKGMEWCLVHMINQPFVNSYNNLTIQNLVGSGGHHVGIRTPETKLIIGVLLDLAVIIFYTTSSVRNLINRSIQNDITTRTVVSGINAML